MAAIAPVAVERRGLYYPWVHFSSDDWVKRALIVFPGLHRMVSQDQQPDDSELVNSLRANNLIRNSNLRTNNTFFASRTLETLIREDLNSAGEAFQARFGRDAAKASGQPSFQMNLGKDTSGLLPDFLVSHGLAWRPDEIYMDNPLYHELHPDLGHAVMGTLAMACAEDEGLHIVGGDSPRGRDVSAELNCTMAAGDMSGPYKHFVRKELRPNAVHASSDDLFHSVVNFNCDVSALRLDGVMALQAEREPLRNLKQKLQEMALTIPPMANLKSREEAFRDKANEIISHWKVDNLNWSKFVRELLPFEKFGAGSGKLAETIPTMLPAVAGATAWNVVDATAGISIALLTHVGVSYAKVRKQSAESPFRYMTLAQQKGVSFYLTTVTDREPGPDVRPIAS